MIFRLDMIKGSKMTLEQRRKLSESHKGKTLSEEHRNNLKGRIPWNKGKKFLEFSGQNHHMFGKRHNPESLFKMSESHKKRWQNPEYQKHQSEVHIGKSSPLKGRHIQTNTGRTHFKKGQLPWNTYKPFSEESKKRMSESQKKYWLKHPELREKMSEIHKGKPAPHSRETLLKLYESGSFPKQTNTKPERQIKEELIKRGYKEGIDFIHQYKFMNKFMCDFCFPQQKVIVEVYGDFWHANPKKYLDRTKLHPHQIKDTNKDRAKEAYITKVDNCAWTYLVLWEMDINKNVSECVDKIEEVLDIE